MQTRDSSNIIGQILATYDPEADQKEELAQLINMIKNNPYSPFEKDCLDEMKVLTEMIQKYVGAIDSSHPLSGDQKKIKIIQGVLFNQLVTNSATPQTLQKCVKLLSQHRDFLSSLPEIDLQVIFILNIHIASFLPLAKYYTGRSYQDVKNNDEKANFYFKSAFESYTQQAKMTPDPHTYYMLGFFHQEGMGTKVDDALAIKCYKKCIGSSLHNEVVSSPQIQSDMTAHTISHQETDQINARYRLGEMYFKKEQYLLALQTLKPLLKTTNSVNAGAAYLLGRIYETGREVKADVEKACEYYRMAITSDKHPHAMLRLAILLVQKEKYMEAVNYFNYLMVFSKDLEIRAMAQLHLANLYRYGFGAPQDISYAIHLYKEAQSVNLQAALFLGEIYEEEKK